MLTASLNFNDRENWKPYWNRALVFLFIATFFLDGITRYKHMISALMIVTAIYQFARAPKKYIDLFKNNLFLSILALSLVLVYAIIISPDIKVSFKEFNNTVLKGFLLYTLLLPILLKDEDSKTVNKVILFSFITSLSLRSLVEIVLYIQDYNNGIMPFTNYEHRNISDSMVFLFPALLNLWLFKKRAYKAAFLILSAIYLFLILGTLSRGAWLSIFVVAIVWTIFNRQWKLLTLGAILFVVASALTVTHRSNHADHEQLLFKLQQTGSSNRYTNGTQGSAWALITENPIKGYGYGDNIYHEVYNKRVIDYPKWIFKKSIGPHNIILCFWFAAGIFGLLGLLYVYGAIITETTRMAFKKVEVSPFNGQLLLFLSFTGFYILRGNFEQVNIELIGIIAGLVLSLKNKK